MALIQCPECGREVSDKAQSCPQCGYPIENANLAGRVKIQLPNTQNISGGWVGLFSSKETAIKSGNELLWQGKHGQTAIFEIGCPTEVEIDLGTWANPVIGLVEPKRTYQLVQDYGMHMKATFRLAEVDVIDSGPSRTQDGGIGFGFIAEI